MTPPVRAVLIIAGVIAVLIGGVFAGQGIGVIPGSFMTGDRTWLFIGLGLVLLGVALLLFGTNRRRPGA
jgi:LPXTG-motif cell wall-anchored protein